MRGRATRTPASVANRQVSTVARTLASFLKLEVNKLMCHRGRKDDEHSRGITVGEASPDPPALHKGHQVGFVLQPAFKKNEGERINGYQRGDRPTRRRPL